MTTLGSATAPTAATDWIEVARKLGPAFATRASDYDERDGFIAENMAELKAAGVLAAGVPRELGGGDATHAELCKMLRALSGYCGSTALTLAMHSHTVATAVWRWRKEGGPIENLLRRIAAENLLLVSSGGSDWLRGSGTAERVEGGWQIKARKIFASGAPAGDLLITSAVYDDPTAGPTVLHFAVPLRHEHVALLDTWRVLGMRATSSQDVRIDGFFVPDAGVMVRRPQGRWHPLFHVITMMALPLIYSVYLGIAEAAREKALALARPRAADPGLAYLVGELELELTTARLAWAELVALAADGTPGVETTNRITAVRTLLGRAAIRTVEKAMEVAGGTAFYREYGLERLFRDVQGARYHPLQEKVQLRMSGRLALGLDIDE
jgi:acyl-CoA dehydrogenase